MCLVEVNLFANLVVSCAMPILNNMKIYTFTDRVRRAREAILEFLLLIIL
jgi:NADH dehydrogenase/NADH:ubiquinone oxidoreductase subunit G